MTDIKKNSDDRSYSVAKRSENDGLKSIATTLAEPMALKNAYKYRLISNVFWKLNSRGVASVNLVTTDFNPLQCDMKTMD